MFYGLGVGFVFLILIQYLKIIGLILYSNEKSPLLGTSKELVVIIDSLLRLITIPIGFGLFGGIGLFMFGGARMIYALFEKEDSKINPTLVERIITAVVIIMILAVAIPNLLHSYREANKAQEPQKISN